MASCGERASRVLRWLGAVSKHPEDVAAIRARDGSGALANLSSTGETAIHPSPRPSPDFRLISPRAGEGPLYLLPGRKDYLRSNSTQYNKMNEFKVLVIDDDPGILGTYQTVLSPSSDSANLADELFTDGPQIPSSSNRNIPFAITTVQQGLDGVQAVSSALAQGSPYAVVFTDMRMPPGIDGMETAKRIIAIDPDTEIAIVTAYSDHSLKELDDVLGQNRFLLLKKPFDSDELIQMAQFLTFRWKLSQVSKAYERFVPKEFLTLLNRDSIVDVKIGDHIQKTMSILFSDIRAFTHLSESLTPNENFRFLNSYLGLMGPIIREHHGIVDKYIGDAIMGIFDESAENAIEAAISMRRVLYEYNDGRKRAGYTPIKIGIGINTGVVMLGTVGEKNRMEGSVVSDAVNLASRVEALTKLYRVGLLISDKTFLSLPDPTRYAMRIIDSVAVKGKQEPVCIFELFDADPLEIREAKLSTKTRFEEGIFLFFSKHFTEAKHVLQDVHSINPEDEVVELYIKRCEHFERYGWAKGAVPHPFIEPLPV